MVGVIVPNYNYAWCLPERLTSILSQGEAVGKLIFLDDASTDDSMAVAEPILSRFPCPVSILRNAENSNSVFRQWARGVEMNDLPFTWIAEADDSAEPGMLDALARRLVKDESAFLAFSDSIPIGPDGEVLGESSRSYAAAMGDHALDRDMIFSARDFVARCLCPRNLVVSASAVVWRTEVLRAALQRLGGEISRWRCAGDWRIYLEAAAGGGTTYYDARALNRHRRNHGGVTHSTPRPRHFAEVVEMHAVLRTLIGRRQDEQMRIHLGDLRRLWGLG